MHKASCTGFSIISAAIPTRCSPIPPGTAQVIIPHVLGVPSIPLMAEAPTLDDVAEHTRLVVSFGGISMKNMQINQGGIGDHSARDQLQRCHDAGVDFICISPVADDIGNFFRGGPGGRCDRTPTSR